MEKYPEKKKGGKEKKSGHRFYGNAHHVWRCKAKTLALAQRFMAISPMALSPSFIQYSPLHAIRVHRQFSIPSIYTPQTVLKKSRHCFSTISCSAGRPIPTTEEEVLQAVLESDEKILPCVRTYENDLSRLTLVGGVDFRQSVTAAAADGGEAASEHLDSGMSAMVVETVFPGTSDEHSTVSTRLVSSLLTWLRNFVLFLVRIRRRFLSKPISVNHSFEYLLPSLQFPFIGMNFES